MKKMLGTTMKRTFGLLCVLVLAGYMMMTWASTPVGVTPTLIGRGTFSAFKVKSDNSGQPSSVWSGFRFARYPGASTR